MYVLPAVVRDTTALSQERLTAQSADELVPESLIQEASRHLPQSVHEVDNGFSCPLNSPVEPCTCFVDFSTLQSYYMCTYLKFNHNVSLSGVNSTTACDEILTRTTSVSRMLQCFGIVLVLYLHCGIMLVLILPVYTGVYIGVYIGVYFGGTHQCRDF